MLDLNSGDFVVGLIILCVLWYLGMLFEKTGISNSMWELIKKFLLWMWRF